MRQIYSTEELDNAKKEIRRCLMNIKDAEPSKLIKKPEFYLANKTYIHRLMFWLKDERNATNRLEAISINERSFEIFFDEKFLEGKSVQNEDRRKLDTTVVTRPTNLLKNCGVELERLVYYEATEPLAYHIFDYNIKHQKILIIENSNTYFSMEKCFHAPFIIGDIGYTGILYGRGNSVTGNLKNYQQCLPTDVFNSVEFGYFGDLDYEGIHIYQVLKEKTPEISIQLCVPLYEMMVNKLHHIPFENLPNTKKKQSCKKEFVNDFLKHFCPNIQDKMRTILEMRKYVPQEILSFLDFKKFDIWGGREQ